MVTAPGKRNFLREATPSNSANHPMAEQTGQQATCIYGECPVCSTTGWLAELHGVASLRKFRLPGAVSIVWK